MDTKRNNEILQPFCMKILPIKTLFLVNFEKAPDEIYKSLELQYLVTAKKQGYRIIAYRNDEYVDIYDEEIFDMEGDCEVCGKGQKHFRKTSLSNPYLKVTENGVKAGFAFLDYKGRRIEARIEEHAKRKTKSFDMIAPVGLSSENPQSFPAFAMYTFDFARTKHTEVSVRIDGKEMRPDLFPVPIPKDGQMRSLIRYGMDCELVEFAKTNLAVLETIPCGEGSVEQDGLIVEVIKKEKEYQIKKIRFAHSKHRFEVCFKELFPDLLRMQEGTVSGEYRIQMEETIGYLAGYYKVKKQKERVQIELNFADGWVRKNPALFEKLLFHKKSMFTSWPKTYCYRQEIDLHTFETKAKWERI